VLRAPGERGEQALGLAGRGGRRGRSPRKGHLIPAPGQRGEGAWGAGRWPRLRGVLRGWPPRRVTCPERQVSDVKGPWARGPPFGGGASGGLPGGFTALAWRSGAANREPPPIGPLWPPEGSGRGG